MDGRLSDSQLDREIEAAVGIEPSPEFLARVRTRIAAEPALVVESGFSRIRRLSFQPLAGVAVVAVLLAIVIPQLLREETDRREVARMNPDVSNVQRAPIAAPPEEARTLRVRSSDVRRDRPRPVSIETRESGSGLRRSRFDDLVLIAPGDQEAFDRLLAVVNDQTVELIAPLLESTRAGVDVTDAAVPVPLRAEEGVNE
jgi:hypothetical protein